MIQFHGCQTEQPLEANSIRPNSKDQKCPEVKAAIISIRMLADLSIWLKDCKRASSWRRWLE
jgi:hypothetical protein